MNFIDGIAISNYRSFGPEIQKIGPFSKINIIIGKNNSGKSNILRYINFHLKFLHSYIEKKRSYSLPYDDNEIHLGLTNLNIKLGLGLNVNSENKIKNYRKVLKSRSIDDRFIKQIISIIETFQDKYGGMIWIIQEGEKRNPVIEFSAELISYLREKIRIRDFQQLFRAIGLDFNGSQQVQLFNILKKILLDNFSIVDSILITDFRQIASLNDEENPNQIKTGAYDQSKHVFDGSDLIKELARLESPIPNQNHRSEKDRFNSIEKFVGWVTNSPQARLSIPYSQNMISVDLYGNNHPLRLESLGAGIHEVIIMAAACTINENKIVCIEEPELHLHPLLQKKFIQYIDKNTSNQYFISTHSAHFLNTSGASVFHVVLENGESKVSTAYKISEKSTICRDLGYQPSDIFQTNCIIWVEGPSDRIYLNYWIRGKTSEYKEGLHYSIMFYGGRLLSNLTSCDDSFIDDFISLRKLNRRTIIVMDSDKENSKQWINKTKRRIKKELTENEGLAWVTKGREIENYLSEEKLSEAIESVHSRSNFVKLVGNGQFGCVVKFLDKSSTEHSIEKIRVAKKYIEIEEEPNYYVLDLDKKIEGIIKFIQESNQS